MSRISSVGGLAGFSIGFVGGAILGGSARYIAGKIVCDEKEPPKQNGAQHCLDQFCRDRAPDIGNIAYRGHNGKGTSYFNSNLLN